MKNFIKSNRFLYPLSFWLILLSISFFAVFYFEGLKSALSFTFIITLPYAIPLHIHEYIFERYLLNKKYLLYVIFEVITLLVSTYFFKKLEFLVDPGAIHATLVSIFFYQLLYIGIKYVRKGILQQFKLKELEAKQAKAELELLKSQVNPHFLFNSLNSIYSLTLKNSEKTSEAVLLLSDLMRYILESSKKEYVPLREELQFIDNYINLETLRLGSNFNLKYKVTGESKNLYIAPMILITFIENLFKHGVSSDKNKNEFEIKIDIEYNKLYFITQNNIVPKSNKLESKSVKTGIENVKKRLELIYSHNYYLKIENNKGKFKVDLQIKLNNA